MRRWFLIGIILGYALTGAAQISSWKQKGDSRLQVYYHPGDEENASGVLQAVDEALPDLEGKLGVILSYPPQIVLATSQEEFDRITGGTLPTWSQGVSFPERGAIVLKSPAFSHDIQTCHRTAVHELVHLMVGQKSGHQVPRWLNEGLALMLSGEGPGKPLMPLSRALWSGGLQPLMAVEQVDAYPNAQAELAYLQSYHATEFLIRQYGWETLRRLLDELGQGRAWDEALFRQIEIDQAGFEATWLASLNKSYRWMILLDSQLYIFVGMTLLVLIAGIAIIRRRRRIYKRWEAEDSLQQADIL
jgi:hypothetical protein